MSSSPTRWFSQQEIEDNSIIQQYHMNSIVGEVQEAQYTLPYTFSPLDTINNGYKKDPNSYVDLIEMKPSTILNTTYILPKLPPSLPLPPPPSSSLPSSSKPHFNPHPSSRILSFKNGGSNVMDHEYHPTYLKSICIPNVEVEVPRTSGINRKATKIAQPLCRSESNAQDHIIAERKRREKLTQRFVALSALIPGLKKMDKASVLGDALNHIKYLQERVREFEEEKKETRMESMVLVKKSKLLLNDKNQSTSSSSSFENGSSGLDLPEIEVRFSDKDVMIKILCQKQKGHLAKILAEIEKFRFSITKSSVVPFGSTIAITIAAQKENNFDMTLLDVVKSLRFALSKFM